MFKHLYHKYVFRPLDRLRTVFAYMKQGWNTYNWDFDYLLGDIVFKLELMKRQFKTDGVLPDEDVKEMCGQIDEIIGLIKQSWDNDQCGILRDPEFLLRSPGDYNKAVIKHNEKMAADWNKIFELMAAYLPTFWD